MDNLAPEAASGLQQTQPDVAPMTRPSEPPRQHTEAPHGKGMARVEKTSHTVGSAEETKEIKRREKLNSKLKAELLGFMRQRAADAQKLADRGEVLEGLDSILLQQLQLSDGEQSIFTKLDTGGGDLNDQDIALVWSALAITETSGLSALGKHKGSEAQTEDIYEQAFRQGDRPERGIHKIPGLNKMPYLKLWGGGPLIEVVSDLPRELRFIRRTRVQLERAMYKGGAFAAFTYGLAERGMQPLAFELQNGSAFHNAVAERIQSFVEQNGTPWKEYCGKNPEGANAVLHSAYEAALPLVAGKYVEQTLLPPNSTGTADAITSQIENLSKKGKKANTGGNLPEKERDLKEAQRGLKTKQRSLETAQRRYGDLAKEISDRAVRQDGLRTLPTRITAEQAKLQTLVDSEKVDIEELKSVTNEAERRSRNESLAKKRETIAATKAEVADMEATLKKYQEEDAVDVDETTANDQKAELKTLKTQIDGTSTAKGLRGEVEDAEDAVDKATEERDEAKEKAEVAKPADGETESDNVVRMKQWANVASREGMNNIYETSLKDRLLPEFAAFTRDHLANTAEVTYGKADDAGKTVQGAEVFRQLVLAKAAEGAGNVGQFDVDRAREAIRDTDIVFAMMQMDENVGGRGLATDNDHPRPASLDTNITTVRLLATEVARLRKGSDAEKKTARDYEYLLIRSALPAIKENRWLSTDITRLAIRVAHEGIQQAAMGESRLNLEGLPERKASVRIRSAETLAKRNAGKVDIKTNRDGSTTVDWKGGAKRRKQRGPGHEFEANRDEIHDQPEVQVSKYSLKINGEMANESFDAEVTEAFLQKLPAILPDTFNEEDRGKIKELLPTVDDSRIDQLGNLAYLQTAFPGATEAELRKLRKRFYRKRVEPKAEREKKKKEQKEKEEKPQLAKVPRTNLVARLGIRNNLLLPADRAVHYERTFDYEDIDTELVKRLQVTQEAADLTTPPVVEAAKNARGIADLYTTERELIDTQLPPESVYTRQAIDMLSWMQFAVIDTIQDPDLKNTVLARGILDLQQPRQDAKVVFDQMQEEFNEQEGQGIVAAPGAISPDTAQGLWNFWARNYRPEWGNKLDGTEEAQAYADAIETFTGLDENDKARFLQQGKEQFDKLSDRAKRKVRVEATRMYMRFPAGQQEPSLRDRLVNPAARAQRRVMLEQRARAQSETLDKARRLIARQEVVADTTNNIPTMESFLSQPDQEELIQAQLQLDRLDALSKRQRAKLLDTVGVELSIIDGLEKRIADDAIAEAMADNPDMPQEQQDVIRTQKEDELDTWKANDRKAYWKAINGMAEKVLSEEEKKDDKKEKTKVEDNTDEGEYVLRIRQGTNISWFRRATLRGIKPVQLVNNRPSTGEIGKIDIKEQQGIHQVIDRATNTESMEAEAFNNLALSLANEMVYDRSGWGGKRKQQQERRRILSSFAGVDHPADDKIKATFTINLNTEGTAFIIRIKDTSGQEKTASLKEYYSSLLRSVNASDEAAVTEKMKEIQAIQTVLGTQLLEDLAVY